MEQLLVCPFTFQPLRVLSESELLNFHERIEKGMHFFQKGVPLEFLPQKAYISQNCVYIYLELDGVLLLQKQTAIVDKNHTESPLKRPNKESTDAFYQSLGLNPDGTFLPENTEISQGLGSNEEAKKSLKAAVPKTGGCLVTMGTNQVDDLHNLLFGTEFREYLHFDHDLNRLRSVVGNLKTNTQYVLSDKKSLSLPPASVDALFSYDFIEAVDQEDQTSLYSSLKRILKADATVVILSEGQKASTLESRYKLDTIGTKAKSLLTPWKKLSIPQFMFHRVPTSDKNQSDAILTKRSLGSQLS